MRIAALVFGILAGLVASLVLALGGLDVSTTVVAAGDRQAALLRFCLLILANLGVFAAAVMLAAPRAGTVLAILAAVAWVVASLLLGHGPDFILITPPVLLLLSAAFGILAALQAPAHPSVAHLPLDLDAAHPEQRETDAEREAALNAAPDALTLDIEPSFTRSKRQPVDIEAEFSSLSRTDAPRSSEKWRPGRNRPVPPRATPNFRQPEDDDEFEPESVFARIGRNAGSLLSFLLYGTLAAAAVLIFWTLRTGNPASPAVAVIDPSSPPRVIAEASSSSEPVLVPILPSSASPIVSMAALPPSLPVPSSTPPSAPPVQPVDLMATSPAAPESAAIAPPGVPVRLDPQTGLIFDDASTAGAVPLVPRLPPDGPPASSSASAESADAVASGSASEAPVMPFTMSQRMAAARLQPTPSVPPPDTTGL